MKSAQNQLISSEIFPENSHEIGLFLSINCFLAKLALKIFHESPAKLTNFSVNLSLKILWNLTFFLATQQKPCLLGWVENATENWIRWPGTQKTASS